MSASSLTGKAWVLECRGTPPDLLAWLVQSRGLSEGWCKSLAELSDPSTLGDCHQACERLRQACKAGERVGIIGDYDADGITGTVQLVRFLRQLGSEPEVLLPHRERDGYGVKSSFFTMLQERQVALVLTVDTGITAVRQIAEAKERGIDVIVLDHHTPHAHLPHALLLHPRLPDREYANPDLSGAGVVFTFLRALHAGAEWEGWETDCALAAIGLIADVVPLCGENRKIVQLGLAALNAMDSASPLGQFVAAIRGSKDSISSTDVAYRLAPRINASGRMADPGIALAALLEGGEALEHLHRLNSERQEAQRQALSTAEELVDHRGSLLIVRSDAIAPGVLGLVAAKLTEKYGKPSLVLCDQGHQISGSLRSIPEYSITAALERCSEHFLSCGGHAAAGGCVIDPGCIDESVQALLRDAEEHLEGVDLSPQLRIACPLEKATISIDLARSLEKLEPFGQGNPDPVFLIPSVPVRSARCVGAEGQHLQCRINGQAGIGFGMGHLHDQLPPVCDVACRLSLNQWNGREQLQLVVVDIRPSRTSPPVPPEKASAHRHTRAAAALPRGSTDRVSL